MLSANVSAFSIRTAVGGGGGPVPYVLEIYVIAGGGTGANWFYASGGGAPGEYLTGTVTEPAAGLYYTVTIGAGGSLGSSNSGTGNPGSPSYFYRTSGDSQIELYCDRGEGGSLSNAASSFSGGGGGGGGRGGGVWTGSTHSNGYDGGDGSQDPFYNAGGGAGTGGDGEDGGYGTGPQHAAAGGAGYAWLDGVTRGGGGGGARALRSTGNPLSVSAGGSGGGGTGGSVTTGGGSPQSFINGGNGSANTGSGGGGGGRASVSPVSLGGNGGSGVAIVRYQGAQRGTGGTITSAGGYTYHTFTSSGGFITA